MKKRWYVTYKIEGFPDSYEAGPYSIEELEMEKHDIETYDRVYDVAVIEKPLPKNSSRPIQ